MPKTFGYARVSTKDQQASLDTQIERLESPEVGASYVYRDVASGARASRPGLDRAKDEMKAGDTLVVTKLDRLGRTTVDTLKTIEMLNERGVIVRALDVDLDTSTAAGMLVVTVMSALAQYERDRLIERTQEGLAHARSKGKKFGRPPVLNATARAAVVASLDSGMSVTDVANLYRISRLTVRRAYEDETGMRPMDRASRGGDANT